VWRAATSTATTSSIAASGRDRILCLHGWMDVSVLSLCLLAS
jgi:hypothetical protein